MDMQSFLAAGQEPRALLIADLGYGDAGKGSVVDYLARVAPVHTVVRYNGGAQAAHNVVTPDGRHHTFAQFGSATFIPGVETYLSRYMLLHPIAMLAEERHLQSLGVKDSFERTFLDRNALVITPFQQAANRLKEIARGEARHGSCGMGVGETMADWLAHGELVLQAGDLCSRTTLLRKLRQIRDLKLDQLKPVLESLIGLRQGKEELDMLFDREAADITADLFTHFASRVQWAGLEEFTKKIHQPGITLFEGAQGVLLDEWRGFYPYNSWSTLTFQNADTLLAEAGFYEDTYRLGLIRGYATRHGAGPFVTEDSTLTSQLQDAHNIENPWQRSFRVGFLDLVALQYALAVTGKADGLAVTNLDRMAAIDGWRICEAYRYPGSRPDLSDYFECFGKIVTALKVAQDPTDLTRQETLTRMLLEMQPVYSICEPGRQAYLEQISRLLHLPIALTSWGPTAHEKKLGLKKDSGRLPYPILSESRVFL